MSIVGYLDSIYVPFRLPWGLDIAMTSIVFYTIGYFFKNNNGYFFHKKEFIYLKSYLPLVFITVHLLVFTIFNEYTVRIDMQNLEYGNYFTFYLTAFSGIITYVYLFKKIKKCKILEFYGKNSLIVLGLHVLIIGTIKHIIKLLHLNRGLFEENIFFILLFTTLTLPDIPQMSSRK